MTIQKWRKAAFILAIVGAIQFVITISIAMLFYAGGNIFNPSAPGYSIWANTWSDLGRTVAWSGNSNFFSLIFFMIAMVGWAISYVPSIYALTPYFSATPRGKLFGILGTVFAIVCASCLVGDVFLPADLYPQPHNIFAGIGYLALLGAEVSFAYLMFSNEHHPNKHAICFSAVAAVIILYLIFNMFLNSAPFQKAVSITLVITTFIVFYDVWKWDK